MAGFLLPALNGSLWRTIHLQPSLVSGRDVAGLLVLSSLFFLAVDARLPLEHPPRAGALD